MTLRPPIRYRVFPKNPAAHLFEVSLTLAEPAASGQRFSLPVWIPGSYLVREFARHVVSIGARCGTVPLAIEKLDKHTWQVAPCAGALTVACEIYAFDLSVRAAYLDTTRGYFNGPSVFLCPHGCENDPCEVDIVPPADTGFGQWQAATALPRAADTPAWSFGRYLAANYDELIDHPVEMGEFTRAEFHAGGVAHALAITGRQRADVRRLTRDLARVCERHIALFQSAPPMDRYVFLINAVGEGYGGLEHRASTSLVCSRDNLPREGEEKVTDDYRTFLGLASHEYFHAWNVKRIRPAAFTPYELGRENYTRDLWVYEGITSYYDDLALVRCGLITAEEYLKVVAENITRVLRGAGRHRQSVAESSFDAWIKFYRQDENSPNAIVSYYAKGAAIALALDLVIRHGSKGRHSLDEVMRELWERHGRTGVGVPEGGVERIASEIAGHDLKDFFDAVVRGTEDLPFAEIFPHFGVTYTLRVAESDKDKGGTPAKAPARERAVLGARLGNGGEPRLSQVFDGGAAQRAGLSAGDVLVAIDGLRVTTGNLDKMLDAHAAGDRLRVLAFRRDELMEFTVTLQAAPLDTVVLALAADASEAARERREAWLRGS